MTLLSFNPFQLLIPESTLPKLSFIKGSCVYLIPNSLRPIFFLFFSLFNILGNISLQDQEENMGKKIVKHLGKNVGLYGCARMLCIYIYIFLLSAPPFSS